jgi:hypothetical protein
MRSKKSKRSFVGDAVKSGKLAHDIKKKLNKLPSISDIPLSRIPFGGMKRRRPLNHKRYHKGVVFV